MQASLYGLACLLLCKGNLKWNEAYSHKVVVAWRYCEKNYISYASWLIANITNWVFLLQPEMQHKHRTIHIFGYLHQCWAVLSYSKTEPVGKGQVYGTLLDGSQTIKGLVGFQFSPRNMVLKLLKNLPWTIRFFASSLKIFKRNGTESYFIWTTF